MAYYQLNYGWQVSVSVPEADFADIELLIELSVGIELSIEPLVDIELSVDTVLPVDTSLLVDNQLGLVKNIPPAAVEAVPVLG